MAGVFLIAKIYNEWCRKVEIGFITTWPFEIPPNKHGLFWPNLETDYEKRKDFCWLNWKAKIGIYKIRGSKLIIQMKCGRKERVRTLWCLIIGKRWDCSWKSRDWWTIRRSRTSTQRRKYDQEEDLSLLTHHKVIISKRVVIVEKSHKL